MGLIDTSELLNDPDFIQPLTLIRRTPCVDAYGENKLIEKSIETFGCVEPVDGKTLQRLPEALRVANVQSFWLRETIIADKASKYPDIIVSNGVRFAVQVVFDWSSWGQGWTEGTCVQERPSL